jgi:hypothetical protein
MMLPLFYVSMGFMVLRSGNLQWVSDPESLQQSQTLNVSFFSFFNHEGVWRGYAEIPVQSLVYFLGSFL